MAVGRAAGLPVLMLHGRMLLIENYGLCSALRAALAGHRLNWAFRWRRARGGLQVASGGGAHAEGPERRKAAAGAPPRDCGIICRQLMRPELIGGSESKSVCTIRLVYPTQCTSSMPGASAAS